MEVLQTPSINVKLHFFTEKVLVNKFFNHIYVEHL